MQSLFSSLTDYIPIIQLFIGNGPLVYLQKKFENPTTDIHDTLTDKYQKFFYRYQAALHDQERRHLNVALRNDKDWLINAGVSIAALAISSFVYCMLLMVYAIEEYMFDLDKVAGALLVVAVTYFIYNAIILIGFGRSKFQFFRNRWGRMIVSVLLLLILCFFCKLGWSVTDLMSIYIVNIIALLFGLAGIVLVWLGIFFRDAFLRKRLSCMEEMSSKMDQVKQLQDKITRQIDPILDNNIIKEIRTFIPQLSNQSRDGLLVSTIGSGVEMLKNEIVCTLDNEIVYIYQSLMGQPRKWWYRS